MDQPPKHETCKTLTPLETSQVSGKHEKMIKSENINIKTPINESANIGLISPSSPSRDTISHSDISEGDDGINLANLNISASSISKDAVIPQIISKEGKEENTNSLNQSDQDELNTLPGETVKCIVKDIQYICPSTSLRTGKLALTNYKLFFQSSDNQEQIIVHLPLGLISKVKRIDTKSSRGDVSSGFEVICKHMRDLRFKVKRQVNKVKVSENLQQLILPLQNHQQLFAFEFHEQYRGIVDNSDLFDPIKEFKRQGIPNDSWRITTANEKYLLCETYPHVLCVSSNTTDEELKKVAEFRSKARLPVLSWMHPVSQAVILRSSQPLSGISVKRSSNDENYLQKCLDQNAHSHKLCIFDARPKINAIANKTLGGGYESEENYLNTEVLFLDIQNIHSMRSSYQKLKDICYPSVDESHFLSNIEKSGWLFHIKQIIAGALRVAHSVESNKTSVLVHCSDGWDRTAQLTGLAMIMLDPYYRSIKGFKVLIEKEWLSFGHQFANRLGHSQEPHEQMSPVFVQFIDCVWQITRQFPNAFEFNESFLLTILEHIYSCLFGTFLENCEMKRRHQNLHEKTVSLWAHMNTRLDLLTNALYAPYVHAHVLYPIASLRRLRLWNAYYMSWNSKNVSQDPGEARNVELHRLKLSLQKRVQDLSCQLNAKNTKLAESSAVRISLPN